MKCITVWTVLLRVVRFRCTTELVCTLCILMLCDVATVRYTDPVVRQQLELDVHAQALRQADRWTCGIRLAWQSKTRQSNMPDLRLLSGALQAPSLRRGY
jgi:hypothetical protein